MEWHPYAKLFPMLSDERIEALAEDIRQNGLRTPIVIDAHERIIDGRNRSAACLLANVKPVLEVFPGNEREILSLVISLNYHRRHLNESQRAMAAAKMVELSKDNQGNTKTKKTDAPIGAFDPVTQDEAAGLLNVGRRSVQRAANVSQTAIAEVSSDVTAGKLSVSKATKVAKLSPADQQKARASGYKESPIETASFAMKYAEQAVTILSRIREDDDQRRSAFDHVSDWIVEHFPA